MRTDSTRVSPSALNLAKETLGERDDLGEELYQGRTWQAGGQAQDAHEAIRPTHPEDPAFWPETLEGELDEQLVAVYSLIYNRFLASQMVPAVYRETTLELETGEYSAEAVGNELQEPGFLRVWGEVRPGHQRDEVRLPTPEEGSTLNVERAWPEPEETQPPPRYREGSLVSELKNQGIGRPSTYGDVLSKIKRTGFGYVRKVGSTLRPTEKGEALVDYLAAEYPRVVDYEYTARMESDLDRIETGELGYSEFLAAEFEWLEEPYRTAERNDWLSGDKPTVPQIEFLSDLAAETETSVRSSVFESQQKVSTCIDKLQDEMEATVRLTSIHEATVGVVDVWLLRV
jgi:DNA topoisomerase-1